MAAPEGIAFSVFTNLVTKLGAAAAGELGSMFGLEDELGKLKGTLSTIQASLVDADERKEESDSVQDWIRTLNNAVYLADEVLDAFATKALQRDFFSSDASPKIKFDAVFGLPPMISALSVNPSKQTSPVYLLPRFPNNCSEGRDWRVPIEAPSQLWLLHIGNTFEKVDENGSSEIRIHSSSCSYQWFNFQKMFGYDWQSGKLDSSFMNVKECYKELLPHLVQVSINLDASGNFQECCLEPSNDWSNLQIFRLLIQHFLAEITDASMLQLLLVLYKHCHISHSAWWSSIMS